MLPITTLTISFDSWIKVHVASKGAPAALCLNAIVILLRINVANFDLKYALIDTISCNKPTKRLLVYTSDVIETRLIARAIVRKLWSPSTALEPGNLKWRCESREPNSR